MFARRKIRVRFWLGVFAVTLGIFVWSWFHPQTAQGGIAGLTVGVRQSDDGFNIIFGVYDDWGTIGYYPWVLPTARYGKVLSGSALAHDGLLGFKIMPHFPSRSDWYFAVGVPIWFILGLSAICIFLAFCNFKRVPGLCANCGYDLRASSERCPECGTAVVREANPTAVC